MFWLIEWHETDGNDARGFDSIVEADTEDDATGKLHDAVKVAITKKDGVEPQDDGNTLGFYFRCDCPPIEDSEGGIDSFAQDCTHGGTSLRSAEGYATREDAERNRSEYHTLWEIPDAEPERSGPEFGLVPQRLLICAKPIKATRGKA